ncbi:hypothetical protein [Roseomonas sp. AR75]|uniref:hypothetical protein n=1 Tax=Roseomonas sp. AR75 TaxID=2562311 RepID=UPI0010C038D3|nr:hypothetical protein [Roseomonas sp. AR75]
MARTFFSEEECLDGLREALGAEAPGPRGRAAEEVAHALLDDMAQAPPTGAAHAQEVRIGRWAIRDDELDLLTIIKDGVLAYLAGKSAGGPWVGLAISVARQLLVLWRKGVPLTADQAVLLAELRRVKGPRDEAGLAAALEQPQPVVVARLEALTAAPARAGPIKLVERLPDGRWIAHA